MHKIKHSKIRNTGLLFEFLLRQITADVFNKNDKGQSVKIVKESFNENTELGKELSLYQILINQKFKSDSKADYFINEVLKERTKLNNTQLKREKYNLIKKLKESYNMRKFLSSKVNHYPIYASIYKLFEGSLSPTDKTESHFNLVEHITTQNSSPKLSETIGGTPLPKDEDLRLLTYQTLLERFNKKYSKLNLAQKNLLREYINNVSNTNSLKETIKEIIKGLKKDLKTHSKNLQDKVVKIKMNEALNSMNKFCGLNDKSDVVKDEYVTQTMRYLELLKELKKSGNKNKKVI
tara:strand:- start:1184 stop:2062 length:879 start_codon:yes stop_codon:yes gene_type:complete